METAVGTGLIVHVSDDVTVLADALGDVLGGPRLDPFVADVVAVPGAGMRRWLAQRLSRTLGTADGDGVCAGVDFPSIPGLLTGLSDEALGIARGEDPWGAEALTWAVEQAFDAARGHVWFGPLAAFLDAGADGARPGRRYRTARRIAQRFHRYARLRPEMIAHWRAGADDGPDLAPISTDDAWQPALWRLTAGIVATPDPQARLATVLDALRLDPGTATDAVLALFAPEFLSEADVAVLTALAAGRAVHVFLASSSAAAVGQPAQNPLLARLGAQRSAVTEHVLAHADDVQVLQRRRSPGATLLGGLQHDVLQNVPEQWRPIAGSDRSLELHASHGADRQVEVLRELLVDMLDTDPTLQPRDIVVLCPDLPTFAPLLAAAFGGLGDTTAPLHPGHGIRLRIAEAELRRLNPLLDVVTRVLALATSRGKASELLDLIALTPVSRRFHLGDDDVARVADLLDRSGVRWGIDSAARARYGLQRYSQNTWAAGLNRILLGVALSEDDLATIGSVIPLGEVDSSAVSRAGAIGEIVSRLRNSLAAFADPATPAIWAERLRDVVSSLTAVSNDDAWQLVHVHSVLASLADSAASTSVLDVGDVQALLDDRFSGQTGRVSLLTGDLNVCGLNTLRLIPHRVICLLGLDDDVFPRNPVPDGDDLLAGSGRPGEPDARLDDRQAVLDAVLAAEERLVVIYRGRDPRTNAVIPASVPVLELLDAAHRTGAGDGRVLVEHPVQPFSPLPDASSTFDRVANQGASVLAAARRSVLRHAVSATENVSLPPYPRPDVVTLDDLTRFYRHPASSFLRTRAGLWASSLTNEATDVDSPATDELPLELDGLQRWTIMNRLLALFRAGHTKEAILEAELRRGSVAPDALGRKLLNGLADTVSDIVDNASGYLSGAKEYRDVTIDLGSRHGCPLPQVVGRVAVHTGMVVDVVTSRVGAKYELGPWIRALALAAADPTGGWSAVVVGRGPVTTMRPNPDANRARNQLAYLVDRYLAGLQEPLPLPLTTATALAAAMSQGRGFDDYVLRGLFRDNDSDDAWRMFYPSFESLVAVAATPDDLVGGMPAPSRLAALSQGVYGPLLAAKEYA